MPTSKSPLIDDIPESYQEYIVTIYRLSSQSNKVTNIEISQKMKIKPSSVHNMLVKLKSRNFVDWKPKQKEIRLTPEGEKIGRQLILGYLIMELFLREYLGLTDHDVIHNLACKLEHHVTEPIQEGFRKKIGEETFKKLEHIVENDDNPEATVKKIKEIFPTPVRIIHQFTSDLIQQLPEEKKLIESMKKQFLKQYSTD